MLFRSMIATEPLPASFWEAARVERGQTFTDYRHLLVYGQRTADDRIAFGGRGARYHWGSAIRPEYDRVRLVMVTTETEQEQGSGIGVLPSGLMAHCATISGMTRRATQRPHRAARVLSNLRLDGVDRRSAVIFISALLCLWAVNAVPRFLPTSWTRLSRRCFWSASTSIGYGVIPLLVADALHIRPSAIGMRRAERSHWRIYALLFALAVPFVVAASFSHSFQTRYPLVGVARGQHDAGRELLVWWSFYAVQFVAVELFFRGFLVLGLAPRFGESAVLIATLPYLAVHFTKPAPEALAAIAGGLVMGALAYRTRSIWWGVALHLGVAALMDVLALGHKGFIW